MPIVNTSIDRILKGPPPLPSAVSDLVLRGMKVLAGTSWPNVVALQLQMLDCILEREAAIRSLEGQKEAILGTIRAFAQVKDIDGLKVSQRELEKVESQLASEDYGRHAVMLVADDLASRMLDADTIKGMSMQPSAGFLSGKEGLRAEVEAFAHFNDRGYKVLLNDLTHSVKYGDLTLVKGDDTRFFEVKTSAKEYLRKETFRQIEQPLLLQHYIKTDVLRARLPSGDVLPMVRVDGPEQDWNERVGGQLFKVFRLASLSTVTRGIASYIACRRDDEGLLRTALERLTEKGDWVAGSLRTRVTDYGEIPPFTRKFKSDVNARIVSGDVIVVALYCLQDLEARFTTRGVRFKWWAESRDLFRISYTSSSNPLPDEPMPYEVAAWQRLCMLYAFLAPESFVESLTFLSSPAAAKQFEDKVANAPNTPTVKLFPALEHSLSKAREKRR